MVVAGRWPRIRVTSRPSGLAAAGSEDFPEARKEAGRRLAPPPALRRGLAAPLPVHLQQPLARPPLRQQDAVPVLRADAAPGHPRVPRLEPPVVAVAVAAVGPSTGRPAMAPSRKASRP